MTAQQRTESESNVRQRRRKRLIGGPGQHPEESWLTFGTVVTVTAVIALAFIAWVVFF
jgi:hypothetical protein